MIAFESLKDYSLFGGLQPDELESIRPLLETKSHDAGDLLLREGQPNDRIYFILEGSVSIERSGTVLATLGEGDTFGEMEFLDVMPAVATVRARVATTVAAISNRALRELSRTSMRAFALVVMNLARDLSRRLRRMDEIVAGLRSVQTGSEPPASPGGDETGR
jgi:CRP/FNR family transcriptional regulator, cyclic AMP receptor protein